jgi:hypothetical protein
VSGKPLLGSKAGSTMNQIVTPYGVSLLRP